MQKAKTIIVGLALGTSLGSGIDLGAFADTDGPTMRSAEVAAPSISTNLIDILFDEAVLTSSATTNNIRLVRSGTAGPNSVYVTVSNILVSGRTVRLRVGGANWQADGNYYIIANNVADSRGNLIAPNSVIPFPFPSALVPTNGPANLLQLTSTRTTNGVCIQWPNTAPNIYYGYILEETEDLASPGSATLWRPVSNQSNPLVVPIADGARFYRLRQGPNTGR